MCLWKNERKPNKDMKQTDGCIGIYVRVRICDNASCLSCVPLQAEEDVVPVE